MNTASEFTSEGTKALQATSLLHKAIQRKKLCIGILIFIGCVVLGLILWPVIKTAIETANAQTNARAAKMALAKERAREEFDNRTDP